MRLCGVSVMETAQFYILSMTPNGVKYPFGHLGLDVWAMSISSFLCTPSLFAGGVGPWAAQYPKLEDYDCGNSDFQLVNTEIVRDHLYQMNVHKSMGPEGFHPRDMKELGDVMAEFLLIIYQRSCESGKVPPDWKLASVISIYKKDGEELRKSRRVNAAYEAPTYEEVMTMSAPAIWTITSNPGSVPSPLSEPPPYSVVIESSAQQQITVEALRVSVPPDTRPTSETDTGSRIQLQLVLPPRLQRFVSDIHEEKNIEDRFEPLEPLTPPPAYESTINDEVFEDAFQPSTLHHDSPSMNTEPNPHPNTECS
ncbi:hypothetical protein WISP_38414 [Willisornis vidua]|uniref:RNA-directed DNA polymerase from mobile element jockey n=1 Tax=Willisornis vidua TaxID=1566151 RepID=A0ABQ9DHQ7_9PASS|nr:hypothetical protein WISP_38414 [Willisornis vidua]